MLKFSFFKDTDFREENKTTVQSRNMLYSVYYTDINAQNSNIY